MPNTAEKLRTTNGKDGKFFSDAELDDAFGDLEIRFRHLRKASKREKWPDNPETRALIFTHLHAADQLLDTTLTKDDYWPKTSGPRVETKRDDWCNSEVRDALNALQDTLALNATLRPDPTRFRKKTAWHHRKKRSKANRNHLQSVA
jgi:hypothetical protein